MKPTKRPRSDRVLSTLAVYTLRYLRDLLFNSVDDLTLWPDQKAPRSIAQALELTVRAAITSQKSNPTNARRYSPRARDADILASHDGAGLIGFESLFRGGHALLRLTLTMTIQKATGPSWLQPPAMVAPPIQARTSTAAKSGASHPKEVADVDVQRQSQSS
jgi:hypothetical protein